MTRHWQYKSLGALRLSEQSVTLDGATGDDPQGIIAFVEHDVMVEGRLGIKPGAIRYVKHGWLRSVLDRPHPMARQALLEGADIGVYIHAWDDPMAAAAVAMELERHDQPPWNLGIRR